MSSPPSAYRRAYDVIVIGAGPVGCVSALAQARQGASILLLEANLDAANRLAGEWLHPGAVEILLELGIDLHADSEFESGHGFAVFPEDGSEAITLPYEIGASPNQNLRNDNWKRGWSGDHRALVDLLRSHCSAHSRIHFLESARVQGIEGQIVSFRQKDAGGFETASAPLILGADGRSSRVRAALGLDSESTTISRMAGLKLSEIMLPFEGYGHVFVGGPGPILAYRIQKDQVRLCIDLPNSSSADAATLWDAYSPILPEAMRESFRRELKAGSITWAANQIRPRIHYGRPGLCLVGDAVGYRHPLTAAGITLGMADGLTLARQSNFSKWKEDREQDTRVADMLGGVLYEVFTEDSDVTLAMRKGVYKLWRRNREERIRTMRYLSGELGQQLSFMRTFSRVTLPAVFRIVGNAVKNRDFGRSKAAAHELAGRARWLIGGILGYGASDSTGMNTEANAGGKTGTNRRTKAKANATNQRGSRRSGEMLSAHHAIQTAAQQLISLQGESANGPKPTQPHSSERGKWEGEVIWCPMLAAQTVIFSYIIGSEIGSEISPERRKGFLRHFEQTQFETGLWGLHTLSPPYLFVTTLVYVAARILGVDPESDLLKRAGHFIRQEGVTSIPSWGKLWLALAGLYDWRGVPPVVPELWALPANLPFHPSKFYCHTRQIYLSMSALYARKLTAPDSVLQSVLRKELYNDSFHEVNWTSARRSLRRIELVTPPSLPLRLVYEVASIFERHHSEHFRHKVLVDLEEKIRWELRCTNHLSISPVSGLLNILALWAANPNDPEIKPAMERLDAWIWDDEEAGTRVAGARSASWDTAFALQALAAASPHSEVNDAIERGRNYLWAQQMGESPKGYEEAFRLDLRGGWSFTTAEHAWPVSDCTAEAVEALLQPKPDPQNEARFRDAMDFILRCQNRDGGFGSYEAKRPRIGLEWLNPAEMFGDSMTEHTYVECTGSCIAALQSGMQHYPTLVSRRITRSVDRAIKRLRIMQRPDGAWEGVWAVHLIYGTLFGIRGLVSAGAPPSDPALRRARHWLLDHQRSDGGWGESHEGCLNGRYTEHSESQVIHTAWALLGLLEASESDWPKIEKGAAFLIAKQHSDGSWPNQDPAGLFFRTALLEYELYRQIFPLWALSLYETRRKARLAFSKGLSEDVLKT